MLPRHEPEPRRQVPTAAESTGISDCRQKGGCSEGSDTRDRHQASGSIVAGGEVFDFARRLLNPFLELLKFFTQSPNEKLKPRADAVRVVGELMRQISFKCVDAAL
jgi:hypothetical protein